jgi:hypothetical protein
MQDLVYGHIIPEVFMKHDFIMNQCWKKREKEHHREIGNINECNAYPFG